MLNVKNSESYTKLYIKLMFFQFVWIVNNLSFCFIKKLKSSFSFIHSKRDFLDDNL